MWNINSASEEELRKVPGITANTARQIPECRTNVVGLMTPEDLRTIPRFKDSWLNHFTFGPTDQVSDATGDEVSSEALDTSTGGQPLQPRFPLVEGIRDMEARDFELGDQYNVPHVEPVSDLYLERDRALLDEERDRFIADKIEMERSLNAQREDLDRILRRDKARSEEHANQMSLDFAERAKQMNLDFEARLEAQREDHEKRSLNMETQIRGLEIHFAEYEKSIKELRRDNEKHERKSYEDSKEISKLREFIEAKKDYMDFERSIDHTITKNSSKRRNGCDTGGSPSKGYDKKEGPESVDVNLRKLKRISSNSLSAEESDEKVPDKRRDNSRQKGDCYKSPFAKFPVLPKSIRFTGDSDSSWPAFKAKFDSFAVVHKFTKEETFNHLCWCLEGKASVNFAMLTKRNKNLDIDDMYGLFETSFDFKDLEETALLRFQSANQMSSEPLEEWADRCLQLADKAFKLYTTKDMINQACMRFCQGAYDKKAGHSVSNQRPQTMEAALEQMRLYQFNDQAIYGKSYVRKSVAEVVYSDYSEDSDDCRMVRAITNGSRVPRLKSSLVYPKHKTSKLDDRLDVVEDKILRIPSI